MEVNNINDNLKITEIANEPFKFSISNLQVIKESVNKDDPNAPIKFDGQASTTEISTTRHKMNEPAIQKMKETCLNLPMFWDHDESRRAASIVGVKETSSNEFWPIGETAPLTGNPVLDAPILQVKRDLKDPNCQVGMSIGGIILKARFVEDMDTYEYWFEIDDIQLYEVSLTTIPALNSTKGKTKLLNSCKGSICSQIFADMRQNIKNSSFNDAISRIEQRKDGSKLTQKLEVDTMTEEKIEVNKKEWNEMKQSISTITQYVNGEIESKKLEQQKAAEEAARAEMKNEVKQEVMEEFKETVIPALAETANKAFTQKIAELTGDRSHIQASAQGGLQPPGNATIQEAAAPLVPQITQQNDPKQSIALNQKCVVWGQTTNGHTPREYLDFANNQS